MSEPRNFLIFYDRATRTAEVSDLGEDTMAALATYTEHERALLNRTDVEVVLIRSESIETLKRTHSSYFGTELDIEGAIAAAQR